MLEDWPQEQVANWLHKFNGILFFQPWGPIESHKSSEFISNLGQNEKIFSTSALTPSVKPLEG
jgi:hypothetical protein